MNNNQPDRTLALVEVKEVTYLGFRVGVGLASKKPYAQRLFVDKGYNKFSLFVSPDSVAGESSLVSPQLVTLNVALSVSSKGNLEARYVSHTPKK
jgi:hypothetical protein